VRVPKEAGKGKARVTLSFSDWKQGRVEPATFEVPTVDASLWDRTLEAIRPSSR
jgi:hypothetical protein